jgi:hypothetical protein
MSENKKEFVGIRDEISPKFLIDEKEKKDFQSFFLILGLIFNDIKGLIFFQKTIEDLYRRPNFDEVSAHAGEYNGLMVQIDKLLISTVGEFFIFIEKNSLVLKSINFLFLFNKLELENQKTWSEILKFDKGSTLFSKIAQIRSNVAFHYDHSRENLRRGFINSFYTKNKDLIQHKRAYYSLGDTMENTRIYYADAAVADYVNDLLDTNDRGKIMQTIHELNHAIQSLLRVYLKNIKK